GGVGAQKQRELADLFRRGEFARGLLLGQQPALCFFRRELLTARQIVDLLLHERREHPAGTDGVAGDRRRGGLERDHLGKAQHAVLRGDVSPLRRRGDQPVRRGGG